MKMLVVLMALVASSAFAQSKRDIYDLQYLPVKGTVYGATAANYTKTNFSDGFDQSMRYTQAFGFSLSDSLLLSTDLNYSESKYFSDGPNSTTYGFNDPSLDARYRAIDGDFRLDVLAGYSLSAGRSTSSNTKSGRDVLNLGVEAGHKWENLQWSAALIFDRSMESVLRDGNDDDSYNSYTSYVSVLGKVAEKVNLIGRVIAPFSDFFGPGATYLNVLAYQAELQYVASEKLLLRASASYADYEPDRFAGLPEGLGLGLGALYQF